MAVQFLNEKLNTLGKIGCLLTVFGSIIIVIHAPKESEVNSLFDFARKIAASGMTLLQYINRCKFIENSFRICIIFINHMCRNFVFNDVLWATFRL